MRTISERVENLSNIKRELLRLKLEEKSVNNSSQKEAISNKQIIAYLVAKENNSASNNKIDSQSLRTYLSTYLPGYMIPSRYIFVESFPLSPSGKVDMNTIRDLENVDDSDEDKELVLPSSDKERLIADIWKRLFNLDQISIHDNFFDLGGNSLLAIQLCGKIEQSLGVHLPLIQLFESPTVRELAIALKNTDWTRSWHSLIPIQTNGGSPLSSLYTFLVKASITLDYYPSI